MFRTVLVHVDTSELAASRTKLAIDLARQYDATLIGMTAGLARVPVAAFAGGYGAAALAPDVTAFDQKHVEAEFGLAAMLFKTLTENCGLETDWRSAFETPSAAIVAMAAAADIVVLGAGGDDMLGDLDGPSAGEIVMRVGRPVLVVPNGCDRMRADNVLIAWRDSPEVQRAIADAVPFMKRATNVTLLRVQEGNDRPTDLAEAEAFLVRHGIAAKSEIVTKNGASVVDTILDHVRQSGADMIVAGAYSRGRLRERVFGGVTRGLLTRAPVPCMFSH